MNRKRVMIAAPKSGSGKTMVTCALLSVLKKKGYQTVSCKCGPDYIDPMFHEKVIGVPSKNLDTFFTGEAQTKELFFNHAKKSDAVVLEEVMGLYDGLGGIREEGSSYHLAKITKTPVILVIDAKGMGRSIMALTAGFLDYDTEHLIRGVILNKISKRYYEVIKPLIERELKLPVLGFLPETKEMQTESRHLGLVLPEELENIREKLETASEKFKETVSIEEIMKIAADAEEIEMPPASFSVSKRYGAAVDTGEKPVIAVAKDEAFCFYYADNIQMLKEYGAEIKYFSPLHDEKLPVLCHVLLIGGGFLYLHTALKDRDGNCYAMAGAVPAVCYDTGKTVRFGYIEISEKKSCFLPEGTAIKGHEFHYFDSTDNGTDAIAKKTVTGREYPCIIENGNCWIGFPHLYYPSNPAFAGSLVEKAKIRSRQ